MKTAKPDNRNLPTGAKHGNWKGDSVSYGALHDYIKYYKPKPEACSNCGEKPKRLDLANISQTYKRDLDDWEWLCRRCHMIKDGRMNNLRRGRKQKEWAKCGRDVVARGICMQQYNHERGCGRVCESCAD